jgi:hypothetical protein
LKQVPQHRVVHQHVPYLDDLVLDDLRQFSEYSLSQADNDEDEYGNQSQGDAKYDEVGGDIIIRSSHVF